jgi:hypothetical protein
MDKSLRIAFDAQVVSYFLAANQAGYDPSNDDPLLAREKVAAFCLWMYVGNPVIVPTVFRECSAIPATSASGERNNREHHTWNAYHFSEVLPSWLNAQRVETRAQQLNRLHKGPRNLTDCRIVAECEEPGANVDALAVFDSRLLKNLRATARIPLLKPFECLIRAGVTKQTPAKVTLKPEHPLSGASWWRLGQVLGIVARGAQGAGQSELTS